MYMISGEEAKGHLLTVWGHDMPPDSVKGYQQAEFLPLPYGTKGLADVPFGELVENVRAEFAPPNCVRMQLPAEKLEGGAGVGYLNATGNTVGGPEDWAFASISCSGPKRMIVEESAETFRSQELTPALLGQLGAVCADDCILNNKHCFGHTGVVIYDADKIEEVQDQVKSGEITLLTSIAQRLGIEQSEWDQIDWSPDWNK